MASPSPSTGSPPSFHTNRIQISTRWFLLRQRIRRKEGSSSEVRTSSSSFHPLKHLICLGATMRLCTFVTAALLSLTLAASAQATPQATQWPTQYGTYSLHNFHFKDGETIPELRLHYITLGTPHRDAAGHIDNAILLLHGTGGNAHSLAASSFSDPLFGPGQPFDITKFFLILPDDIGHGQSSKPSDGLRMHFPKYDYDDMVASQHAMLEDGLHIDHLRLILGTSMGCMESFTWGEAYPQAMDGLAAFACLPVELAGRNRVWRDMAMQDIKLDPAWKHGNYKREPLAGLRGAFGLTIIAGKGA